jgi:hypothetical protein
MPSRKGGPPGHSVDFTAFLIRVVVAAAVLAAGGVPLAQERAECTTPARCRQLALDAIAQRDYERAHDFAWRVVQTSPPRDTAAMSLLARAQSLSGRGYDALIMLERLAAVQVIVADADTSEDFRRVREYPQWPQLLETMTRLRAKSATPPPGAAPPTPAAPPAPPALAAPSAPPAPPAPSAPSAPAAPAAPPVPIAPSFELALPAATRVPVAFAHDAVSARFVTADDLSDVLRVVSETAGTATNLNSPGWSGNARVTALAISPRTGDLWVAGALGAKAALHRLQLISGRLIQTFMFPGDAGEVRIAALAVTPTAVLALDAAGRRIFARGGKGDDVRVQAALPRDISPTGLAYSGSALFVSHTAGMLRLDMAARNQRAVTAAKALNVANLHSLAWHDGGLLAVRGDDDAAVVVRLRLNSSGSAVTAVERLDQAAATAAVLSGQTYFYLVSQTGEKALSFRGVPAGK